MAEGRDPGKEALDVAVDAIRRVEEGGGGGGEKAVNTSDARRQNTDDAECRRAATSGSSLVKGPFEAGTPGALSLLSRGFLLNEPLLGGRRVYNDGARARKGTGGNVGQPLSGQFSDDSGSVSS
ncbi:unnamed protein product, partial [Ectocarpus sp. 12 AP-2014]